MKTVETIYYDESGFKREVFRKAPLQSSTSISVQEFHANPPSNFGHPRNLDWIARVLELQTEMTHSDAQGKADLEYRIGKLPSFCKSSKEQDEAIKYRNSLQEKKRPTQLGTNQKKLIAFLLKYPGWHSFAPNPTARKAVASLVKRKLIRENEHAQVCI